MKIAGIINKQLKKIHVSYICKSCGEIIRVETVYDDRPELVFGGLCKDCEGSKHTLHIFKTKKDCEKFEKRFILPKCEASK